MRFFTWIARLLARPLAPQPAPEAALPPPAPPANDPPLVVERPPATGPRGTKGLESRAWRNRNPGNLRIRSTKLPVDHIAVDNDPGGPFGIYASERDGWADLAARIIQMWQGGNRTVAGIIHVWAPPSENNTAAYIAGVARALGVAPDAPIDPRPIRTMRVLAEAIRRHEGKSSDPPWDPAQREAGLLLAGCLPETDR